MQKAERTPFCEPYDLDVRIMTEQMKAYFMSRGADAYTAGKQATVQSTAWCRDRPLCLHS